MDWSMSEWKQGLSSLAVQKVHMLEEQVERFQKERQQKQLQIENLEQALNNQKRKAEEEKSQNCCLTREVQKLDSLCKEYEEKYHRSQNEIQSRDAKVKLLESQLLQTKQSLIAVPALEADVLHHKSLLESLREEMSNLECKFLSQMKANEELRKKLIESESVIDSLKTDICNEAASSGEESIVPALRKELAEKEKNELSSKMDDKLEIKMNSSISVDDLQQTPGKMCVSSIDRSKEAFWDKFESQKCNISRSSLNFMDTIVNTCHDSEGKLTELEKRVRQLNRELECQRYNSEAVKSQLEQKFKEKESLLKAELKDQAQVIAKMDSQLKETAKLQQENTQVNKILEFTKTQLEKLETVNRERESELKDQSRQLHNQDMKLCQSEKNLSELLKLKQGLEVKNTTSQLRINHLEEENQILTNNLKQMEDEMNIIKLDLNDKNVKIEECEAELLSANSLLDQQLKDFTKSECAKKELENEFENLSNKLEEITQQLSQQKELLEEKNKCLASTDMEMQHFRSALESEVKDKSKLQNAKEELEEECKGLKNQLQEVLQLLKVEKETLEEKNQCLASSEVEMQQVQSALANQVEDNRKLVSSKDKLEIECQSLRNQLEEVTKLSQQEKESNDVKMHYLRSTLDNQLKENSQLECTKEKLENECQNLSSKLEGVKEQLNQQKELLEEKNKCLASTDMEMQHLRSALDSEVKDKSKFQNAQEELEEECKGLRNQLQEVLQLLKVQEETLEERNQCLASSEMEMRQVQTALANQVEDNRKLEIECKSLRNKLEEVTKLSQQENESNDVKLHHLRSTLDNQLKVSEELEKECKILRNQVVQLNEEKETLEVKTKNLVSTEKEMKHMQYVLEDQLKGNNELQSTKEELEKECKSIKNQMEQLSEQLQHAKETLEEKNRCLTASELEMTNIRSALEDQLKIKLAFDDIILHWKNKILDFRLTDAIVEDSCLSLEHILTSLEDEINSLKKDFTEAKLTLMSFMHIFKGETDFTDSEVFQNNIECASMNGILSCLKDALEVWRIEKTKLNDDKEALEISKEMLLMKESEYVKNRDFFMRQIQGKEIDLKVQSDINLKLIALVKAFSKALDLQFSSSSHITTLIETLSQQTITGHSSMENISRFLKFASDFIPEFISMLYSDLEKQQNHALELSEILKATKNDTLQHEKNSIEMSETSVNSIILEEKNIFNNDGEQMNFCDLPSKIDLLKNELVPSQTFMEFCQELSNFILGIDVANKDLLAKKTLVDQLKQNTDGIKVCLQKQQAYVKQAGKDIEKCSALAAGCLSSLCASPQNAKDLLSDSTEYLKQQMHRLVLNVNLSMEKLNKQLLEEVRLKEIKCHIADELESALVEERLISHDLENLLNDKNNFIVDLEKALSLAKLEFHDYDSQVNQHLEASKMRIFRLNKRLNIVKRKLRISVSTMKKLRADNYHLRKKMHIIICHMTNKVKKAQHSFSLHAKSEVKSLEDTNLELRLSNEDLRKNLMSKEDDVKNIQNLLDLSLMEVNNLKLMKNQKQEIENELLMWREKYCEIETRLSDELLKKDKYLKEIEEAFIRFRVENFDLHECVQSVLDGLKQLETLIADDAIWENELHSTPGFQSLQSEIKQCLAEKELLANEKLKVSVLLQKIEKSVLEQLNCNLADFEDICKNFHSIDDVPVLVIHLCQAVNRLKYESETMRAHQEFQKQQLSILEEANSALSKSLEKSQKDTIELQHQNEILQAKISATNLKLDAAYSSITDLNEQVSLWISKHKTNEKLLDELKNRCATLERDNKMLNATIDEVEQNLEVVYREKQELQHCLSKMQFKKSTLHKHSSTALKKSECQLFSLLDEIRNIKCNSKESNVVLKEKASQTEIEVKNLMFQIQEKDINLLEQKHCLEKQITLIEDLRSTINTLENDNIKLKAKFENGQVMAISNTQQPNYVSMLTKMKSDYILLSGSDVNLQSKFESIKTSLNKLKEEKTDTSLYCHEKILNDNDEKASMCVSLQLESDLEKTTCENKNLKDEISVLSLKLDGAKSLNMELQSQFEKLNKNYVEIVKQGNSKAEALREEIKYLQSKCCDMQCKLSMSHEAYMHRQDACPDCTEMQNNLKSLISEKDILMAENEQLHSFNLYLKDQFLKLQVEDIFKCKNGGADKGKVIPLIAETKVCEPELQDSNGTGEMFGKSSEENENSCSLYLQKEMLPKQKTEVQEAEVGNAPWNKSCSDSLASEVVVDNASNSREQMMEAQNEVLKLFSQNATKMLHTLNHFKNNIESNEQYNSSLSESTVKTLCNVMNSQPYLCGIPDSYEREKVMLTPSSLISKMDMEIQSLKDTTARLESCFSCEIFPERSIMLPYIKNIFESSQNCLSHLCHAFENLLKENTDQCNNFRSQMDENAKKFEDKMKEHEEENKMAAGKLRLVISNFYRMEKSYRALQEDYSKVEEQLQSLKKSLSLTQVQPVKENVTQELEVTSQKLRETELKLEESQNEVFGLYTSLEETQKKTDEVTTNLPILKNKLHVFTKKDEHG